MDYYNYITQRHTSVHGRQSSAADFTAGVDSGVDVASLRFSLSAGGTRYSADGVPAPCGTSTFSGGQHHFGARLDGSAIANGDLSPGRDSVSYGRPFTTSASAQDAGSARDVYGSTQRTMTVNNHHSEPTTSQPQRLRYLPPPPGTVLPPLDNDADIAATEEQDDEDAASLGDGRSSVSSNRSSTSDCRNTAAAAPSSHNDHTPPLMTDDRKDATTDVKSDKTSTNTAAAAGLTSSQPPLIYPWMRRMHSSNNGMHSGMHAYQQKLIYELWYIFRNFGYKS